MNGNMAATTLFVLLALMLPLSALLARRIPIGPMVRMALIWIAIFVVLLMLVRWTGMVVLP